MVHRLNVALCLCSYQDIQTLLSEPCRYEKSTAGRSEHIWRKNRGTAERCLRWMFLFSFFSLWSKSYLATALQLTTAAVNNIIPLTTLQYSNGKNGPYLFCGPSPTRYSMTRSIAPLSLGRMGLANGGPGGCMPAKTVTLVEMKINTNRKARQFEWRLGFIVLHCTAQPLAAFKYPAPQYNAHTLCVAQCKLAHRCSTYFFVHSHTEPYDAYKYLPTPGIGEQGVLGIAEADRADLSGGPPGAERGTVSVGRATLDKDTVMCVKGSSESLYSVCIRDHHDPCPHG